jgi:hypothetical protein
MRIRITEGVCAADTVFRACLAVTQLAGPIVDMDITDNSPPSPGPRSVGVTHCPRSPPGWPQGPDYRQLSHHPNGSWLDPRTLRLLR